MSFCFSTKNTNSHHYLNDEYTTEDDNAVIILCARCLGNNIENDSTTSCKNSLMI